MSTALYLVSHDLRLDDNRALVEAASYETLLVVYCVDPRWFRANSYSVPSMGPHRWRFIKESLADLASKLREYGQHLHVVYGPTVAMLRRIITEIAPQALITNRPHGWYEHSDLLEIQRRFPPLPTKLLGNYTVF